MESKQVKLSDLPITSVDTGSPVPFYHQIETDLRQLIRMGALVPEDILPPELELSKGYGVGRHTMRTALSRLVADNLIIRKAGLGTYVAPRHDRKQFYLDRSFTRQIAEMGLEPRSEVLEMVMSKIDGQAPRSLQAKVGKDCLLLVRLRLGNDEPIGLQYTTIITELCQGLEQYDFNQRSLYEVLYSEYELMITEITHTVNAVAADEVSALQLDVNAGDPLLLVKTNCYLKDHQIIEYTVSYYRTDKYEYSTTHTFEP
jgi:GntR family transcriptional regulator